VVATRVVAGAGVTTGRRSVTAAVTPVAVSAAAVEVMVPGAGELEANDVVALEVDAVGVGAALTELAAGLDVGAGEVDELEEPAAGWLLGAWSEVEALEAGVLEVLLAEPGVGGVLEASEAGARVDELVLEVVLDGSGEVVAAACGLSVVAVVGATVALGSAAGATEALGSLLGAGVVTAGAVAAAGVAAVGVGVDVVVAGAGVVVAAGADAAAEEVAGVLAGGAGAGAAATVGAAAAAIGGAAGSVGMVGTGAVLTTCGALASALASCLANEEPGPATGVRLVVAGVSE
jgi:hypothetical protein